MEPTFIKTERVKTRACPGCGYIIPQEVVDHAKVDQSCINCGKHKLSEYQIYEMRKL